MAYAFDTLGYAKRLQSAGVPAGEAEAHAEAAREFIMVELVTKADLETTRSLLQTEMQNGELRLENRLNILEHRMMIRLGGMLAAGFAVLAVVIKL